jgi:hypothetical protein
MRTRLFGRIHAQGVSTAGTDVDELVIELQGQGSRSRDPLDQHNVEDCRMNRTGSAGGSDVPRVARSRFA